MKRDLRKISDKISRTKRSMGIKRIRKILTSIKRSNDSYLFVYSEAPNFGPLHLEAVGDVEELADAINALMCDHSDFRKEMYKVVYEHLDVDKAKKDN